MRPVHRARQRRLALLAVGTGLAALALVARLAAVQVLDAPRYAAYAAGEVRTEVALPGVRGPIYDRSGRLLAASLPRVDVVADDFLVSRPALVASELAPLLGTTVGRIEPLLAERSGYVVLGLHVTDAVEAKIAALGLPGISFVADPLRQYFDGSLFEPILGGVHSLVPGEPGSASGDAGIEYMEDRLLAGRSGHEVLAESAAGEPLPARPQDVVEPVEGDGLVLTIDEPLQAEATRDVAAEMAKTGARSGVAIVEDVHTGAILAMVDLVRGRNGRAVPAATNLGATAVYQPGSVMKIATFSFALQDHLITPDTVFSVPFELSVGGYWFQDAEFHPTEPMPAYQILAQSSNIGTIEVSRLLGPDRLYKALRALGFGRPTGLGWPGASPGIIGSPATWYGSDLGSIPIGTGEGVTALQILDAFTTVADGGVMHAPSLVAATVSPSGREHLVPPRRGRRVLDASTASRLVPMFEGVVQDGTAVCAAVPPYTVAGKTGTAQVVNSSGTGYVPGDWNATFVGFLPAQAPQLSGIVWLNHPQPIYGGSVSAPVFARIMGWAVRHFDIAVPPVRDTQAQVMPAICNGA